MNRTDEIDELASFRRDMPPMSARAYQAGRRRLREETTRRSAQRARMPLRRLVISGALAASLAAGFGAYEIAGPHGSQNAAAAEVLDHAATAADAGTALHPRSDQFVYRKLLVVTDGLKGTTQTWESADGSKPGLRRSSGDLGNTNSPLPRYQPQNGLMAAPYLVLAELPTNPHELLPVLERDPSVTSRASSGPKQTLAVWSLIRELIEKAPPSQQAALFRTAALLPGIQLLESAVDADGRTGVAIGLDDPRVGRVEMVFDSTDDHYLGERIVKDDKPDDLLFNGALQTTAVVGRVGELPA